MRWAGSSAGRGEPPRRSGRSWVWPERSSARITNLKSSSSGPLGKEPAGHRTGEAPIAVARGIRLRGASGRLTATLVRGGIDQLRGRSWGLIGVRQGPLRRYGGGKAESYG